MSNPNTISDDDIREMFNLHASKFKAQLNDITNVRVVQRIKDVSIADDQKVTLAQSRAIDARLEELDPPAKNKVPDQTGSLRPIHLS